MENAAQEPYRDTPPSPRSSSPTCDVSPSPSGSSTTIKPLPALPHPAPSYTNEEPYRDDPPTPSNTVTPSTRYSSNDLHRHSRLSQRYQPYTDSPPQTPDVDDVPLAHLLLNTHSQSSHPTYPHDVSYPAEAPPPYAIAVRQSYRDTLIQYIPSGQDDAEDVDEESGVELARPDDVRYSVERVVAMFIVATLLLIVSGVLGWLALGSGVLG